MNRRSIYGKSKRFKRSLLRTLGLWSRQHYDVEVVWEDERPAYKKITFKSCEEARRVSVNLVRYGRTPHLPALRKRHENAIWVDFIDGEPCHRIDEAMMPQIAECFGRIAGQDSQQFRLQSTPYWQRHLDNLDYLWRHGVFCDRLHREVHGKSLSVRPASLRIGFDYSDPIGPNLLRRDGCGRICAIDVKNLHRQALVGEGLAKARDRWLCEDRSAFVFSHLQRLGLNDIEDSFSFIRLYERASRVRRKVERDLKIHRRVRARHKKGQQFLALLD